MMRKYYIDINNRMRRDMPKIADTVCIVPLFHNDALNALGNKTG